MSFCWDVYVWMPQRFPEVFQVFIDHYVNTDDPGDERLSAFTRTYHHSARRPTPTPQPWPTSAGAAARR
ncbi:hypothetical protein [Micromonospora lupini]|nr:hypothetical protein [Micromonospora lupini]